jgi:hypothetical protein
LAHVPTALRYNFTSSSTLLPHCSDFQPFLIAVLAFTCLFVCNLSFLSHTVVPILTSSDNFTIAAYIMLTYVPIYELCSTVNSFHKYFYLISISALVYVNLYVFYIPVILVSCSDF